MSLTEASEKLDVHYMTAYKYVRTGRLNAIKERGQWWVTDQNLHDFLAERHTRGGTHSVGDGDGDDNEVRASRRRHAENFRRRIVNGDDSGAWTVITDALASGATAAEIHTDVISPAMASIGERWAAGSLSISQEHLATAVVQRILGRMTPMFRHPGRRSVTIVLGVVSGDSHALPTALMADLLTDKLFHVVNLGANTPSDAFIETIAGVDGPVAVGLLATLDEFEEVLGETIREINAVLPAVPIYVGGHLGARVASLAGVAGVSQTPDEAVDHFETFRAAELSRRA